MKKVYLVMHLMLQLKVLQAGQVTAPVKTDSGYHLIEKVAPAVKVASFEQEKARLQAEVAACEKSQCFF